MEEVEAYLVVTEKNRKLSAMDCMAIENALLHCSMVLLQNLCKIEIERNITEILCIMY